ncbi:MAG: hypothetical protein ACYCVB_00660 [Bacilli bacterium]
MRETINFKAVLLAKMDESDLDNLANFNCVDEQDCTDADRLDLSGSVGIRFVTLDAFPHRVSYYQKMGFRENQVYSRDKRRQFVSMRSDVYEVID